MIWAVIGAGSSGIGVVGKLVDHHQQIIWIDPNFDSIGRMGQYYCDVPANTPNGSIWNVLYLCKSFQIDSFIETKKLNNEVTLGDLPAQECSKLGYLVDALQHISPILQSHPLVSVIHGTVTSMLLTDKWNITVSSSNNLQSIHCADYVIMATGAIPKLPSNISPNSPHHPVDMMVNTNTVKQYFHDHPDLLVLPWAVVGSSHSAMLIIKNMIEVGVQRIVNYYRSDFIFEELTEEGWFRFVLMFFFPSFFLRHRGTGLKGSVGQWVKNEFYKYVNTRIIRHRLLNDLELFLLLINMKIVSYMHVAISGRIQYHRLVFNRRRSPMN